MRLLEEQVGRLLTERRLTLATAESCTGGLICHRLTNVAGSSAYLMGGIVAYSNEAKLRFLNVQEQTLIAYGAVSQETALEMAVGARAVFGTDLAVSVTGIAGPSGGTPEKPVGLTYIVLATPQGAHAQRFQWSGDRIANKDASAKAAFELIIAYLSQDE